VGGIALGSPNCWTDGDPCRLSSGTQSVLSMTGQRLTALPAALRVCETPFPPLTEEKQNAVREQLDRVLASPVFRNSKRYAAVLRYVVERTLDGTDAQLKERTIGIEVFGRVPDYDTATDHAVRSAIAEIRKRLAQYYQEDGIDAELRIELQRGSYVAQFRFATDDPPPPIAVPFEPEDVKQEAREKVEDSRARPRLKWTVSLALALGAVVAVAWMKWANDPLEKFWGPVLSSNGQVLLCVGNLAGGRNTQIDPLSTGGSTSLKDFHSLESQTVHIDDAVTLARIAGFMQARRKAFRVASQSQATYTDLQGSPAVLIGLMNNDWTERLVKDLRFSVAHPTQDLLIIRDRENPSSSEWAIDYAQPYLKVTKDYALVVRVTDPKTDQMVVTIAGLSVFGTLAAGEFVTNKEGLRRLDDIAPRGWKHKNMEIVLSTDVIRGEAGHPVILATRFW